MAGRIDAHRPLVAPVLFSPDGTMLATVGRAERPRVWTVDGELVAEFGTSGQRTAIASHPTEPWVYVGEGTRITRHTLDVDELIESATATLTRALTDECQRYLERSCPDANRPELAAIGDPEART